MISRAVSVHMSIEYYWLTTVVKILVLVRHICNTNHIVIFTSMTGAFFWPFTTFLMLLKFTKIAFIYTRMIVNYHTRYKMNKFGLFKIIPLLLMT